MNESYWTLLIKDLKEPILFITLISLFIKNYNDLRNKAFEITHVNQLYSQCF